MSTEITNVIVNELGVAHILSTTPAELKLFNDGEPIDKDDIEDKHIYDLNCMITGKTQITENTNLINIENLENLENLKKLRKNIRIALVLAHNHDICNEEYYKKYYKEPIYTDKIMNALVDIYTSISGNDKYNLWTVVSDEYKNIYGTSVPDKYSENYTSHQATDTTGTVVSVVSSHGVSSHGGKGKKITKAKKNK